MEQSKETLLIPIAPWRAEFKEGQKDFGKGLTYIYDSFGNYLGQFQDYASAVYAVQCANLFGEVPSERLARLDTQVIGDLVEILTRK
jgi:hypothetical protein